jgi:RNA polymerase sigma-70 factor (ECF subfamily)
VPAPAAPPLAAALLIVERFVPPLISTEPDGALVALSVLGDPDAFAVLFRRYEPGMRRYAMRTLGSNAEADDVVQDAFITAWNKLTSLQNPHLVKSWLMRIVRNKSIDRLRARRHSDVVFDEALRAPERDRPSDVVADVLLMEALETALADLPPNQKRAWLLRELTGCSYSTIAEELDLPSSTVRGLLARARHTLALEMEPWR